MDSPPPQTGTDDAAMEVKNFIEGSLRLKQFSYSQFGRQRNM